jgi:hypothetical protein
LTGLSKDSVRPPKNWSCYRQFCDLKISKAVFLLSRDFSLNLNERTSQKIDTGPISNIETR